MRIAILNGNPDAGNAAFESYLQDLVAALGPESQVTLLPLRDLDIKPCNGCFGCWIKQPGECLVEDDSGEVRRAVIQADWVLLASPLLMGFLSAVLKRMLDRLIPLILPYMEVVQGEIHHRARYAAYPRLALLLEKGPDADDEDVAITTAILQRTALNFKSALHGSWLTSTPAAEIARALLAPVPPAASWPAAPEPPTGRPGPAPRALTVFNGSPRGKGSNSRVMLEHLLRGFEAVTGTPAEVFYLKHPGEAGDPLEAFARAEAVFLAFPLYTDAMPGLVKAFIERLGPLAGRPGNPPIGFLVQSGFPESVHSRYVERYLGKLAARLGCRYMGTVVKGGCEGVRGLGEEQREKRLQPLTAAGRTLALTGTFDPDQLRRFAQPERFPGWSAPMFKLLTRTRLFNSLWDSQLQKNGVYEQRFAQPYI